VNDRSPPAANWLYDIGALSIDDYYERRLVVEQEFERLMDEADRDARLFIPYEFSLQ
jgi:hypothetical protein